jgi:DNA transposition AAA+ family ATPase
LKAKLYDLDENAEDAPRFVVDAYDHNLVVARLAEAERVIENAGCCLVMSNNGAREALNILRGYKQTADSASADCRCRREDGTTRFNINCCIHGKAP